MENYTTTENRIKNIEIAEKLLLDLGLKNEDFYRSGYSDTNGISVYFKSTKLKTTGGDDFTIRVSDHTISNKTRMEDTFCFSFDVEATRFTKFFSKFEMNKIFAKNYRLI